MDALALPVSIRGMWRWRRGREGLPVVAIRAAGFCPLEAPAVNEENKRILTDDLNGHHERSVHYV